jgi:hypothetical protein
VDVVVVCVTSSSTAMQGRFRVSGSLIETPASDLVPGHQPYQAVYG